MIPINLWKRLNSVEQSISPPISLRIVLVGGWDYDDPRRKEYLAYNEQATDIENDPAYEKLESSSGWPTYLFDHTKVPEGWTG